MCTRVRLPLGALAGSRFTDTKDMTANGEKLHHMKENRVGVTKKMLKKPEKRRVCARELVSKLLKKI